METQATAAAPAQPQEPVSRIHDEASAVDALTQWVQANPDNDPHAGTDMEEQPQEAQPSEAQPAEQEAQPEATAEDQIELPEDEPLFEIEYKTDNGKEQKRLSLKELREGYLAKQDYHRNIQKVKAQEQQLQESIKQAELKAQADYLQRLETQKALVLKTVAPELQNVDLNRLAMEDPAEAQRLFFRQIQLNQTLQAIEGERAQAAQKLQEEQKAAYSRAIETARSTLQSEIPGWGEDLYAKVLDTVSKDYGFDGKEVGLVADARLIKVFHDAFQYRTLQKAKPEIAKKVVTVPKVIKPGSAEKPNPAKETAERLTDRLKKTGRLEDAAAAYLARQQKR